MTTTKFKYRDANEKPFTTIEAAEAKAKSVRQAGEESREWAKRHGYEPTEQTVEVITLANGFIVEETITKK